LHIAWGKSRLSAWKRGCLYKENIYLLMKKLNLWGGINCMAQRGMLRITEKLLLAVKFIIGEYYYIIG
jgi:hypothetical protein